MTNKTFGELIHHFMIGGDKNFFMARAEGNTKVAATVYKTKHEKKDRKSCVLITLYRTGNVNGDRGTKIFFM